MDAIDALTTRISPARLSDPAPTESELKTILRAGASAADHGRLRPWRFLLIEGASRQQFGELLAQSLQRRVPDSSPERLAAESQKALRAPLIIVVAAAITENASVPAIEQVIAVGAAAHNILVAAHAVGFGGFWRTGAAAYDPQVKRALELGESDQIVGFLYLGTVATPGKPRELDTEAFVTRWRGSSQASPA